MSRQPLTRDEAIERLRAAIQPEQYIESLQRMKQQYLGRASELLGNRDLNAASGAVDEKDIDLVNKQIDDALVDLNERIEAIDRRVAEFEKNKKGATRPFERSERPEEEEEEEEPIDTSAAVKEAQEEQLAAAEEAVERFQEEEDKDAADAQPDPEA